MDRALTTARDLKSQSQNGSGKLETIFELPSGAIAKQLQLKARDYFAFKRHIAEGKSNLADASQELLLKMFHVNGQPLTLDALDELSFEDVATLDGIVNEIFTNAQNRKKL